MRSTIRQLITPLHLHLDSIIRRPLDEGQLKEIERATGCSLPGIYAAYLAEIGLFQDILTPHTCGIEMYHMPAQFVKSYSLCQDGRRRKTKPRYFPFGHDGGRAEFALDLQNTADTRVHLVSTEEKGTKILPNFEGILESAVRSILNSVDGRLPNDQKRWNVQFSFSECAIGDVIKVCSKVVPVTEPSEEWTDRGTSPAGVKSSSALIKLGDRQVQVTRLDYSRWPSPMFSFDYSEPAILSTSQSVIVRLDEEFAREFPKYRLCDYGPVWG